MKRYIKRLLSGAAFALLLLCLLCLSALAADYNMFITDVRVSDENKDDILGDGVFSFDGDRTLTVRGNCETADLPIIASAIPDLVIRVTSDSELRSGTAPAIVACSDLTILGPGPLKLGSADSCGIYLYGCGGEIRNISVTVSGAWGVAGERPDDQREYLHITNADVTAVGPKGAICDFGGGITLTDCTLEDSSIGANAITDAEEKPAAEVRIRHTGADLRQVYTVTFHNARGANPRPQYVDDGALATAPGGLFAEDYTFTGWYTDAACRELFDFSAPIQSNLHLYSGWEYAPPTVSADKTALAASVELADALPDLDYTKESLQNLQTALDRANAVLEAGDAAQDEVDAALRDLKDAVSALKLRDPNSLNAAIAAAERVEKENYTDASVAALEAALADAKAALETGSQTEIDAAAIALTAALEALTEKPAPVDRTALEQILSEVRALATERYTEESVAAFEAALAQALTALRTGTQEAVDAAADGLRQAVAALAEKLRNPFVDVAEGSYCYDSVLWAYYADPRITNGLDAFHFGPDRGCTRGQAVTFLWRAAGCPAPANAAVPFSDVDAGAYYADAVAWAVENGITNGVGTDRFAPDATCTRGQIVTFLWRFRDSPRPANAAVPFPDVSPDAYCAGAVAWAVENGVTRGVDETHFAPDATCTRGQIVTFLYRAIGQA